AFLRIGLGAHYLASAAAEDAGAAALAVTARLSLQKEFFARHDRLAGVARLPVPRIGAVIGLADHQIRSLAQPRGETREIKPRQDAVRTVHAASPWLSQFRCAARRASRAARRRPSSAPGR